MAGTSVIYALQFSSFSIANCQIAIEPINPEYEQKPMKFTIEGELWRHRVAWICGIYAEPQLSLC